MRYLLSLLLSSSLTSAFEKYEPLDSQVRREVAERCSIYSRGRPVSVQDDVLDVNLTVSFLGIDDRQQTFTIHMGINFQWEHACTHWQDWDGKTFKEVGYFSEPVKNIWYPELLHIKTRGQRSVFVKNKDTIADFYSNGEVEWEVFNDYISECELDLLKFPYDRQNCSLILESQYEAVEIDYLLELVVFEEDFLSNNDIWSLVGNSSEAYDFGYKSWNNFSAQRVRFDFIFQRRPDYYISAIFLPTLALMLLQLLSGFLPPDCPDRASFCVTLLLSFAVLQATIQNNIPQTSVTPYLVWYLGGQLFLALSCTVHALFVCWFTNSKNVEAEDKGDKTLKLAIRIDMFFYTTTTILCVIGTLLTITLLIA